MKAIFASKLYRSSNRKDKIRAALNDPMNVELVQQLRKYLDDEYIDEKYLEPDTDHLDELSDDHENSKRIRPSEGHGGSSGGGFAPMPESGGDFESLDEEVAEHEEERDEVLDGEPEVEESEDIENAPITSVSEDVPNLDDAPKDIKEILNSNPDSEGVLRASVKNDELWIHYNDSINLNNVMEHVIDAVNQSQYSFLNFSRLARTENAIVFTK